MSLGNTFPDYFSDESDVEQDAEININIDQIRRREKRERKWQLEITCNSKTEAIEIINNEDTWSFHYKNATASDTKCYYRCNKVKKYSPQFSSGVYLLNEDETVQLLYIELNKNTTMTRFKV